jgi:hypothetical protein
MKTDNKVVIEKVVNEKVNEGLEMTFKEMTKALKGKDDFEISLAILKLETFAASTLGCIAYNLHNKANPPTSTTTTIMRFKDLIEEHVDNLIRLDKEGNNGKN